MTSALYAGDYTRYLITDLGVNVHRKIRGRRACLYRASWVPKGSRENTHGYAEQRFVGSLSTDAESIPVELAATLTNAEREYVERTVCRPAREAAARARDEAQTREADPLWRLRDAAQLAREAAERSQRLRVPRSRLAEVQDALATVLLIDQVETRPATRRPDALQEALVAIRAATAAVSEGHYGHAPATGVRSTRPYKLWSDIYDAVCGTEAASLMRALQDRGFAKSRAR